jgi:cytochrome b pre-mRNA-processing protein 3
MLQAIKSFFSSSKHSAQEEALYAEIVDKSRNPLLFEKGGVVDSVEGRMEMLYLHLFIASKKLETHVFQAILAQFFSHMDANLREMGVGDLTVPKKIKAIGSSYLGRENAYSVGLSNQEELALAFKRNIPFNQECTASDEPNSCASFLINYTLQSLA